MKKFFICKLCLLLIVGFSVATQAEETDTDLNIFQKLDKWVYDNIDVVGRKDEVTGRREINLTPVELELKIGKQYFDQIRNVSMGIPFNGWWAKARLLANKDVKLTTIFISNVSS